MTFILNGVYASNLGGFYLNRLLRLMVPYWAVTALALMVMVQSYGLEKGDLFYWVCAISLLVSMVVHHLVKVPVEKIRLRIKKRGANSCIVKSLFKNWVKPISI